MGKFTQILLLSFLSLGFFIIWLVAGGYITQATHDLKDYRGSDTDPNLHDAAWYSFWASFVTWFIVALIFILGIIAFFFVIAGIGVGVFFAPEAAAAASSVGVSAETLSLVASKVSKENVKKHSGILTKIAKISFILILLTLFGFCILNGVLALLAYNSIIKSDQWDYQNNDLEQARRDTLLTALISLGGVLLVVTFFISYFISRSIRKSRKNKDEKI